MPWVKTSEPTSPKFSFSYRDILSSLWFYLKVRSPPAARIQRGILHKEHAFSKEGGHRVFPQMKSSGPTHMLNCAFLNQSHGLRSQQLSIQHPFKNQPEESRVSTQLSPSRLKSVFSTGLHSSKFMKSSANSTSQGSHLSYNSLF